MRSPKWSQLAVAAAVLALGACGSGSGSSGGISGSVGGIGSTGITSAAPAPSGTSSTPPRGSNCDSGVQVDVSSITVDPETVDPQKRAVTLEGVADENNEPCGLGNFHLWLVTSTADGNSYEYFDPAWAPAMKGSYWSAEVPFVKGGQVTAFTGGEDCLKSFESGKKSGGHYNHSATLSGCGRWGVVSDPLS